MVLLGNVKRKKGAESDVFLVVCESYECSLISNYEDFD